MASAFVAVLRSSLAEGLCYPDVNASSLHNSRSFHLLTAAFKLNLSLDAYMFTKLGLNIQIYTRSLFLKVLTVDYNEVRVMVE